jgi:hypothetical protein
VRQTRFNRQKTPNKTPKTPNKRQKHTKKIKVRLAINNDRKRGCGKAKERYDV